MTLPIFYQLKSIVGQLPQSPLKYFNGPTYSYVPLPILLQPQNSELSSPPKSPIAGAATAAFAAAAAAAATVSGNDASISDTVSGFLGKVHSFLRAEGGRGNVGIVGNGRLHVLDLPPGAPPVDIAAFDTKDSVYDVAFGENNEAILVAAQGDGSVKLFDLAVPPAANPVRSMNEHAREVNAADYSPVRRYSFVSASWDDTLKIWALDRPASLRTFKGHGYCVHAAACNPGNADVFVSASGDRTACVWDIRKPDGAAMLFPVHQAEVLACDWSKYRWD